MNNVTFDDVVVKKIYEKIQKGVILCLLKNNTENVKY